MKNIRKSNRRAILRARRRGELPGVTVVMPGGLRVTVRRYAHQNNRAAYRVRHARIYGVWPPDQKLIAELYRWS